MRNKTEWKRFCNVGSVRVKVRLLRVLYTSDVSGSRLAYAPGLGELNSSRPVKVAAAKRSGAGDGWPRALAALAARVQQHSASAAVQATAVERRLAGGLRFDPERLNLGRPPPTVTPLRGRPGVWGGVRPGPTGKS